MVCQRARPQFCSETIAYTVPTDCFTTFYVGALRNDLELQVGDGLTAPGQR